MTAVELTGMAWWWWGGSSGGGQALARVRRLAKICHSVEGEALGMQKELSEAKQDVYRIH